MHQFLNQLLAKKGKKKKSLTTGCRSAFQPACCWAGDLLSQQEGGSVSHIPFFKKRTGSTGSRKVFTGRSLDGPRSSFTANHWHFTPWAWSSLILYHDPRGAACPDKKGTELEPGIPAKMSWALHLTPQWLFVLLAFGCSGQWEAAVVCLCNVTACGPERPT